MDILSFNHEEENFWKACNVQISGDKTIKDLFDAFLDKEDSVALREIAARIVCLAQQYLNRDKSILKLLIPLTTSRLSIFTSYVVEIVEQNLLELKKESDVIKHLAKILMHIESAIFSEVEKKEE